MYNMKKTLTFVTLFMCLCTFAQNLVVNGDFSNGLDGWELKYQAQADTSKYVVTTADGVFSVSQDANTTTNGRLDLIQHIAVIPGKDYTVSFEYKENYNKNLRIWSYFLTTDNKQQYVNPGDAKNDPFRTNNSYFDVASEWTPKSYDFTAPVTDNTTNFNLEFRVYKQQGNCAQLRNISLIQKGAVIVAAGVDSVSLDSACVYKLFKNGQLIIIRDGVRYDAMGQVVE